jgi:hypothetical protein
MYHSSNKKTIIPVPPNLSNQVPDFSAIMTDLIEKYTAHNGRFWMDIVSKNYPEYSRNNDAPTCLVDAVCTEIRLPCTASTFREYTETIESDIKRMIEEIPNSLKSTVGTMRCRDYMTPLAIACYNERIPLTIIELMARKIHENFGKSELLNNCVYLMNWKPTGLIEDFPIAESIPGNRSNSIIEILNEYFIDDSSIQEHIRYLTWISERVRERNTETVVKYVLHPYARGVMIKYLKSSGDSDDICSICHDVLIEKNDDDLKVLVCGHIMCNECFRGDECPVCRCKINSDYQPDPST